MALIHKSSTKDYPQRDAEVLNSFTRNVEKFRRMMKSRSLIWKIQQSTIVHADVDGAKAVLSRSSGKKINIYMSKEKVLDVITKRFFDRGVGLASGKTNVKRQSARCPSRWASELMSRNLYYTRQSWFDPNQLHKEVLHELTKNSG